MKKNLIFLTLLITLALTFSSCINREKSNDEDNLVTSEVTFDYSGTLSGSFSSDSVYVAVDDLGASGLWILSVNSVQSLPQVYNFGFTAIGIDFPGCLNIDQTNIYGQSYFDAGNNQLFLSSVNEAGGNITVEEFIEQEYIAGSFAFTLIDSASQDTLYIINGLFHAAIDSSLYITP